MRWSLLVLGLFIGFMGGIGVGVSQIKVLESKIKTLEWHDYKHCKAFQEVQDKLVACQRGYYVKR